MNLSWTLDGSNKILEIVLTEEAGHLVAFWLAWNHLCVFGE